ncbi:MAG TPA: response regulator [Caulobacteraceae bacterium]|nr:response regulator [Caulobacteraceae bacterium]
MRSPTARRILVVEDQAILGMELEFALIDAGHEVVGIATDARHALALAIAAKPDLAIVDINLRDGRTGVAVAQKMASELGVTVLFATAEPELIPEQFGGAYGVVVKPYSSPSVHAAVEYCLALRDGFDPGPPPPHLRLAPWVVTRRSDSGGAGEGEGPH